MATKKAYLEHLRNVSLFQGCSTKELEKIAKASDEITMAAGSLIVDQGQTGREAFIVLNGTVTVKRNGKKVGSFGPGTVVGELSLLDQRHFIGVIDDVPALAHKLLATLAGRIRDLDRQNFG